MPQPRNKFFFAIIDRDGNDVTAALICGGEATIDGNTVTTPVICNLTPGNPMLRGYRIEIKQYAPMADPDSEE